MCLQMVAVILKVMETAREVLEFCGHWHNIVVFGSCLQDFMIVFWNINVRVFSNANLCSAKIAITIMNECPACGNLWCISLKYFLPSRYCHNVIIVKFLFWPGHDSDQAISVLDCEAMSESQDSTRYFETTPPTLILGPTHKIPFGFASHFHVYTQVVQW